MFVQVIQGKTNDRAGLRMQWERWDQDLKPTAQGYLGGTAGVTADGEFIALARFEDEASARANSESAEQSAWWNETSQYLEDPMFYDSTLVDVMNDGGSDDAGFVTIVQGKVTDVEKARRALGGSVERATKEMRPDVIGGIVAWEPENGRFTNAIYSTSESEARANQKAMLSSPDFGKFMSEWQEVWDEEPRFLEISEPWYLSK